MKTVALDPRFKNLKTVDDKSKREAIFADIDQEMREHLEFKEDELKKSEEPCVKKRKIGLDFDESDEEEEGQAYSLRRELETYRAEPLLDKDLDALEWCCIPATSTQAERVFSALGLLLTKRRLSMTGQNVNIQMFLRDNMEY